MFDYKMMPFKLQREEDEARTQKMAKETEQRIADVVGKVCFFLFGVRFVCTVVL